MVVYLLRFCMWKLASGLYALDKAFGFRSRSFTRLVYRLWPDGFVRPLLVASSATAGSLIPHPLCSGESKAMETFFTARKEDRQTLTAYVKKSVNPRWAASHLVRAISNGLGREDVVVAGKLWDVANELGSQK